MMKGANENTCASCGYFIQHYIFQPFVCIKEKISDSLVRPLHASSPNPTPKHNRKSLYSLDSYERFHGKQGCPIKK